MRLSYKFAPKVLKLTQNYTLGKYEEKYNISI